jgi:hypothetical protein
MTSNRIKHNVEMASNRIKHNVEIGTAMTNSFIKMSGTLGKEANIAFENTRKRDDGFSREDEERDDGLRRENERWFSTNSAKQISIPHTKCYH